MKTVRFNSGCKVAGDGKAGKRVGVVDLKNGHAFGIEELR